MASDSPSKKKVKVVDSELLSVLKTVLYQCEKEKSQNSLVVPLELVENRASYYTGCSTEVFCELKNQEINLPPISHITIQQKVLLLKSFKDIYNANANTDRLAYLEILTMLFHKTGIFQSVDHFSMTRQLCALGYEYKNTTTGPLIVENAKLRYERFHYLSKIIRMRNNNKPICYIEVRVIDETLSFEKFSSSTPVTDEKEKYYFLHAMTRNGYVNGIFCNVMDTQIYTKWITDILVSMLAPNSLLVIDSGELFNEEIKPITRYSSKKDMLQWLNVNNIPCSSEMYKPELYELIRKSGIKNCDYKIDYILKAYGHDVLRKPENFHDLTPTALFWNNLKSENFDENKMLFNIKQNLETCIEKIEKLKWEFFSDAIANWEKEIFDIDCQIESILDSYEFQTENLNESPSIPFPYFFSELKSNETNVD